MKTRLFLLFLLVALALSGIRTAAAAPKPAIITFSSSLESITVDEAEAGQTTTTLSWYTAGMSPDYRLDLEFYTFDGWKPVLEPDSVPLEANGSRTVTVHHPLTFTPPTYLLSIVDKQSRIVDQRTLAIPYALPGENQTGEAVPMAESTQTSIQTFTIGQDSMDATALAQGSAQVTVTWAVINRTPTANLVFEQVFDDGSATSVELPRDNLWVQSSGQGTVAPLYRENAALVTLRLRVVDLITEEVLAEAEDTFTVSGTAQVIYPTAAPALTSVSGSGAPVVAVVPPNAEILSFSGTPTSVNPGAAITLSWEIRGTGGITIEQAIPGLIGSQVVVSAQAPKGSTVVYVPTNAVYSILYTLYTADRSSSSIEILVHCPSTFFFGDGNGCPQAADIQISATFQQFEGGFMVWRSDTGEIDVFYNDGQYQNGTAGYYSQASYAAFPDNPGTETPPLNRVAPISGFGKLWANMPDVRSKIGWALGPEQPYTMRLQTVASPSPQYSFYFTLPDGHVIGTGFGTWQIVQ